MPQYDWATIKPSKRDALVAEHVMNWTIDFYAYTDDVWVGKKPEYYGRSVVPSFSSDLSVAWEVVEKLREEWEVEIYVYKDHVAVQLAKPTTGPRYEEIGESLADCISIVALRAKGVDV